MMVSLKAICWRVFAAQLSVSLIVLGAAANAQLIHAQGTWTSNDSQSTGTWQADFDPTGTDPTGLITMISGTVTLTGMPGLTQCAAAGSLRPGSIQFGIMYDSQERAVFTGARAGTSLSGTFTTPDGLNGQWQGQLTANPGTGSPAGPSIATPTASSTS